MIGPDHVKTLAAYNRWQNDSLYGAAGSLTDSDRQEDQGAFFGSIEATLNHLLWGDRIWMSRFAGLPRPVAPNIPASINECASWEALREQRAAFDYEIIRWAAGVLPDDLTGDMTWHSAAAGRDVTKPLWLLITHFFNHQTHHRGQVHCMLTSLGASPDDTDLFLMPPEYWS